MLLGRNWGLREYALWVNPFKNELKYPIMVQILFLVIEDEYEDE